MATSKKEAAKYITIQEYSFLAGITPPAISYRIAEKLILPGIKNYFYDETERRYKLERSSMSDEDIKLYFRKTVKEKI